MLIIYSLALELFQLGTIQDCKMKLLGCHIDKATLTIRMRQILLSSNRVKSLKQKLRPKSQFKLQLMLVEKPILLLSILTSLFFLLIVHKEAK